MCDSCGCGDEAARLEGDHEHEHEHVLADGTVVKHSHGARGRHEHAALRKLGHGPSLVEVEAGVLAQNDRLAGRNRAYFRAERLLALNLMSSPGSGKTTLLEKTLRALLDRGRGVAVLEGDQETTRDADRVRATGAPALQINTGKGCHLEADMVRRGAEALAPKKGSVLFIENVGNLVCPALFDLGEDARVVLFSTTEGEDKPLKYPHMFRAADLVLLTKIDLLPHLDFRVEDALRSVAEVNPGVTVLPVSARTGAGMAEWLRWIEARQAAVAAA